jgi:hypothetical protein
MTKDQKNETTIIVNNTSGFGSGCFKVLIIGIFIMLGMLLLSVLIFMFG